MKKDTMRTPPAANQGSHRLMGGPKTSARDPVPNEGARGGAFPAGTGANENRKILVISREPTFSEGVVDYAVNLAERLGYDLIAMNVGLDETQPGVMASPYRRYLQGKFTRRARAAAGRIAGQVRRQGLGFEHLVHFGDLGGAVEALNQEKRRIEFVLNASETSEAEMTGGVTLPVFTIQGDQGESMTEPETNRKGWHLGVKTLGLGVATAALYAAVFSNSTTIMSYFTRGGWYATLPIATVFAFSFVHGAFSHHVWEVLGIQAPRKTVQPQPTAAKRPAKRSRPRLRLNV
jgi:hypothetical protein